MTLSLETTLDTNAHKNARKVDVSGAGQNTLPENISSFVDILKYRAETQSDQRVYTFLKGETDDSYVTYGELESQVRSLAQLLQSRLPQGSRVLLAYQPGLDFVLAFLACLCAGVVAVPAYAPRRNQKASRLRSIVENAGIDFALTDGRSVSSFQQFCSDDPMLSKLRWIVTDGEAVGDESAVSGRADSLSIASDDLAFLQYTSGSTGDPKGVMVSHGNLLHNLGAIAQCFGHHANSRGTIWLPPYHDMGLIGGVLQPLYAGFPVHLMSPVDFLQKPLRWLQVISRTQSTTSGGPNFAYELAVKKATAKKLEGQDLGLDLSSWEVAFTGAEPIRSETLERFAEVFAPYGFRREAFYPCYGMAESTLIISGGEKLTPLDLRSVSAEALEQNKVESVSPDRETAKTLVSCGQSIEGQSIRIVDAESLTLCSPGQIGEIWVSGESIAQGYWNRPEETAAQFNVSLPDVSSSDDSLSEDSAEDTVSYMRTGDLGFIDEGALFITGRLKDLIIIRGQNHYPQDIELTVERSHAALRSNSGAAFSVEMNRAERLVVVHEVERQYLRQLDSEEVIRSIRQAVTAAHSLEVYAIALVKTSSIPKTSSGKIRRRACREAFVKGDLTIVADWSRDTRSKATFQSLQSQIDEIFQQVKKDDV